MSTVVVGDQPWLSDALERRRALGQDARDEVWEGVYHVAPLEQPQNAIIAAEVLRGLHPQARRAGLRTMNPFNLGTGRDDFRCPDGGWIRAGSALSLYLPTAVAVLEVLSPGDETYAKLPFYRARGVEEVLVASPEERWVRCYRDDGGELRPHERSVVFDLAADDITALVDWP